jgi:hypothetical protein
MVLIIPTKIESELYTEEIIGMYKIPKPAASVIKLLNPNCNIPLAKLISVDKIHVVRRTRKSNDNAILADFI